MPSLIGNKPNQVPSNGDLGTLAFQDSNAVNITGGIVDVSAGSATVASVGAAGDENTGLFFPAADTVAVTTGGTERVRVTSAGDVGVGLNNPATYGSRTNFYVAGSLGGALLVGNPSKTLQGVMLGDSNNGVMDFGTTTNHPVKFLTNNAERMRIDAAGNLLVGTTTAGASKLVVNSDSIQVNTSKTPASATATGTTGQIAWDANYVYVCVATNTWKRSALSTW